MEVQWLLDLVKSLGVAGGPVFAVLWWLERIERRAYQREARDYLTQVLTVTSQSANSMSEVSRAVAEVSETTKDITSALGKLAQLVRTLRPPPRQRGGE